MLRTTKALVCAVALAAVTTACGDDDSGSNNNNVNQAVCGNGQVESGEQCDDGAENSDTEMDACRSSCRNAHCSDGVVDTADGCDDGNDDDGDGCSASCVVEQGWDCSSGTCEEVCGDDLAVGDEECDGPDVRDQDCEDFNLPSGPVSCKTDCTLSFDACVVGPPIINGINGTGPAATIAPRTEHQADYDAVPTAQHRDAQNRIDGTTPELLLAGENFSGTTRVRATHVNTSTSFDFQIQSIDQGGTEMRVRFPAASALPAGIAAGMFILAVTTPTGDATAQVFFLQGQDGTNGTNGVCNNSITGDLTVSGDVIASSATLGDLTVTGSVTLPDCPSGYTRDGAVTDFTLCTNAAGDEMVRVGDFWIDRYEASIWSNADCSGSQYGTSGDDYPAGFPDNGNFSAPAYACSVTNVTPAAYQTWFQAQAACAASGKHLCTNAEWQAAVEGTHDPGANAGTSNALCNTDDTAARSTGQGTGTAGDTTSCVSNWGAEDMIGNLVEWTAEWYSAGVTWQTNDTWSTCTSGCSHTGGWPSGYGDDATWSVNGRAHGGVAYAQGLPAAAIRGGNWGSGTLGGAFAFALNVGPSYQADGLGARCCRTR